MSLAAKWHASAPACAFAAFALLLMFFGPLVAVLGSAIVLVAAYGACVARRNPAAILATALALGGLLMLASAAASAAPGHGKPPILTTLELPPQSLVLAPPSLPQPVVVKVAEAAPAETSVAVPINEWVEAARNTLITILLGVWAFAKNKLPGPLVWAVSVYGERRLIEQAVGAAINATPGVARGVPLTVDVGNQVLARSVQWIVDTVPGFVVKAMGGEDGIRAKVFAALHLEEDASAAALGIYAKA